MITAKVLPGRTTGRCPAAGGRLHTWPVGVYGDGSRFITELRLRAELIWNLSLSGEPQWRQ